MKRAFALFGKDLRLFGKDRRAVFITFLVPIVIASFFGSIMGGSSSSKGPKAVPALVVDEDGSALTQRILADLPKDSSVRPKVVSRAEAEAAVRDGKAGVALFLPKGFGKAAPDAMFSGTAPKVEIWYDPTKSMEMQVVQGAFLRSAMGTVSQAAFDPGRDLSEQRVDVATASGMSADRRASLVSLFSALDAVKRTGGTAPTKAREPFTVDTRPVTADARPDAERSASMAHIFAGMAVQGVLFTAIDAAMGLLRDRRLGIWRRLVASPATLPEMLLGRLMSSAAIGALVLCGVLAFGMLVFGIRVQGSWLGLGLMVAATATMVSAFGLLVASLGKTEGQSRGFATLAVLSMVMLGGGWFPTFMMPGWVQTLSLFVPVRWALDGLDAVIWRGQGLGAVATPLLALAGFAGVFLAVSWRRFAKV